jgi:hypothetical protein
MFEWLSQMRWRGQNFELLKTNINGLAIKSVGKQMR